MIILVIEQEQRRAEETICVHKKARDKPFLVRWKGTRAEEKTMTNVKNARLDHILNVYGGGGGGGGG